ncbi:MAG: type II toxin-antitoxin system HicB family antitoxin [Rhodobacteraceae bacterium]|nr:type II toxin-antitoxin system HicB family antitoxin [Paracoccaceae bacterium]
MNAMTHEEYSARIEFDAEDEIFFGKIAGIQDVVGFHADTVMDLKAAFHEAVDDYVATCTKIGKDPQKPYFGKVMFRINPETHRRAAVSAELAGVSLNQWAEDIIEKAAKT